MLIHISKYEFQPWQRCIQPADTRVIAIHQAGDASISAASYTLHVVSVDNQTGQIISRLATAGSYLLHFTIPVNELQSISRGLKECEHYVNTITDLGKFGIFIVNWTDSMCNAHTLNPQKHHKTTIVRNLSLDIHRTAFNITRKFPKIELFFAHIDTHNNPADYNSKPHPQPLLLTETKLWKEGPASYQNVNPPDHWYLKITKDGTQYKPPETPNPCRCTQSQDFCGPDDGFSPCAYCSGDDIDCINFISHYTVFSATNPTQLSNFLNTKN